LILFKVVQWVNGKTTTTQCMVSTAWTLRKRRGLQSMHIGESTAVRLVWVWEHLLIFRVIQTRYHHFIRNINRYFGNRGRRQNEPETNCTSKMKTFCSKTKRSSNRQPHLPALILQGGGGRETIPSTKHNPSAQTKGKLHRDTDNGNEVDAIP